MMPTAQDLAARVLSSWDVGASFELLGKLLGFIGQSVSYRMCSFGLRLRFHLKV